MKIQILVSNGTTHETKYYIVITKNTKGNTIQNTRVIQKVKAKYI